jgi:putative heme iron utilization protein
MAENLQSGLTQGLGWSWTAAQRCKERGVAAIVSPDNGFTARCLLRAARAGTLATQSAENTPFASLVTHALAPEGSALMLLSSLAAHTRHLRANPHCALMVVGEADGPNPQTAPRVTLTGQAVPEPNAALRGFWRAHHPYAAGYADFTDFALWRLVPAGAHLVGGFARAATLSAAELLPPEDAVQALAAAAERIMTHCNNDHADALNRLAQRRGHTGGWQMISVDCDGFDMACGDDVLRLAFAAPVSDAPGVRAALVSLVRDAE